MMDRWIKAAGSCADSELLQKATEFAAAGDLVIACYTDRFLAVRADRLSALSSFETLLELRVFNETRELWAHRSALGRPFSWRIADDAVLKQNAMQESDDFLKEPENHFMDSVQTLDIDTTVTLGTDEYGSRRLRTTVGGAYALPIAENENCVRIRSYVRYDENGVGSVADARLLGFGCQGKEATP